LADQENMPDKEWTVNDLIEALRRFPPDAKVYYEMGPNGTGTIGKAQYVKAWGGSEELGVLLDR
jgi:hypothetical protein